MRHFLLSRMSSRMFSKENRMHQFMLSVGIDIGTSTTQLVFCKIYIENTAAAWTVPTVKIVDKEIIYRSDVHFTPLKSSDVIDAEEVRKIVELEYKKAKISPNEVTTGAVIITGETARKENAQEVLNMLSGMAGDFVVATAGPDLEGILAGKGSGAFAYSKEHSCTVMNFDIGGGTTNVAIYKNGEVIASECFDIGGRLVKLDSSGRVYYISKKAEGLIKLMELSIECGKIINQKELIKLTDKMAEVILCVSQNSGKNSKEYEHLLTKKNDASHQGIKSTESIDAVFFSGGVADCMDSDKENWLLYGDIGILLGRSLKNIFKNISGFKVINANETIRATVIGAGTHTTDISGSTVNFDASVLPMKNVPIIRLSNEEEFVNQGNRAEIIKRKVKWFEAQSDSHMVALSIRGSKSYSFENLQSLANDIVYGFKHRTEKNIPLIILVDNDIAKSLGLTIRRQLPQGYPVVCIDSISVANGDYIDVGLPVADGQVVPVIIKTLLFGY